MVAHFVALCTATYVVVDDLYRAYLAPWTAGPARAGGAATARSSR